jgi:formate dehydrogenase subunit gamma
MTPDHSAGAAHPERARAASAAPPPSQIQRFLPGERFLHWALAGPFVLLYATAALMLVFYGEPHPRHFRDAFAIAHRVFGALLIVLPPLALLRGSADWRVHLENMREGWIWHRDDFRWLILFPKNALNPKIALPDQGKFNAAEKLNFMMVSTFYPLYIATGVLVWMPGVAIFAYLSHYAMAILGLPLVGGHIFMATINPETKVGLSGMFTGWVDRGWARHHYTRWYREHFEPHEVVIGLAERLKQPARVECGACHHVNVFPSWTTLLERSFQVEPLVCGMCQNPIHLVPPGEETGAAEAILGHLRETHGVEPFQGTGSGAA